MRDALAELLENGVDGILEPLFPGIPVFRDDVPGDAIAPYLLIDATEDPSSYGKTALWGQSVIISLTQPLETPTSESVSEDYDSSVNGRAAYEANLESLLLGRFPITGTDYDHEDRTTYRTLSDLLLLAADAIAVDLRLVDTASIHRPDVESVGVPIRQKVQTMTDDELSYRFLLVGAIEDADA